MGGVRECRLPLPLRCSRSGKHAALAGAAVQTPALCARGRKKDRVSCVGQEAAGSGVLDDPMYLTAAWKGRSEACQQVCSSDIGKSGGLTCWPAARSLCLLLIFSSATWPAAVHVAAAILPCLPQQSASATLHTRGQSPAPLHPVPVLAIVEARGEATGVLIFVYDSSAADHRCPPDCPCICTRVPVCAGA